MRTTTFLLGILSITTAASAETITVSAAASLKESMEATCKAFEAKTGNQVELNFAASGPLESQIEHGAPVDVFVSAANEPAEKLIKAGMVDPSSRQLIARNQLVLVVPSAEKQPPTSFEHLADASVHRIAVGQPNTVPAGMYARQTLTSLKLFEQLTPKLVYGASVRQVLAYVTRDEVDAAIVYATDAKQAGAAVRVVSIATPTSHEPIEYPAVIVKASTHQAVAKALIDFWRSADGQKMLSAFGFEPVD